MPISASLFTERIRPVLAKCRVEGSFTAGKGLFEELLPRIHEYHASYHGLASETLVEQAIHGLPFDSAVWRAVVGEVMLFAADDLPLLRLSPLALCCLLAGGNDDEKSRERFAPIQQVLFGSRDLLFAGYCYRPDSAGFNDLADVGRLNEFLQAVDPGCWRPDDLLKMTDLPDDEERAEELEFVRQGWPDLVEMYRSANDKKQIIVCERN
jgi:hypothetical protein